MASIATWSELTQTDCPTRFLVDDSEYMQTFEAAFPATYEDCYRAAAIQIAPAD